MTQAKINAAETSADSETVLDGGAGRTVLSGFLSLSSYR